MADNLPDPIPGLEPEKVAKAMQELDEGKGRPMEEIEQELGDAGSPAVTDEPAEPKGAGPSP
jgi:hypothetical protein